MVLIKEIRTRGGGVTPFFGEYGMAEKGVGWNARLGAYDGEARAIKRTFK